MLILIYAVVFEFQSFFAPVAEKLLKLCDKMFNEMSLRCFQLSICQKELQNVHIVFCLCCTQRLSSFGTGGLHEDSLNLSYHNCYYGWKLYILCPLQISV